MSGGDIRVVHAIPGRIRLKVRNLKNNPTSAQEVAARLRKLAGVDTVEANATTGSVLVTYGSGKSRSAEIPPKLSEAFGSALFPGVDPSEVHRQLSGHGGGNGNGSAAPVPLAHRIQGFLGNIDTGFGRVSGGAVDLRLLVPVGLLCAGLAIVATSGSIPMPAWYDLVWASFAAFVALNQMSEIGQRPLPQASIG